MKIVRFLYLLIEITHALEKLFHVGKPQLSVAGQVLAEGVKLASRDLVALDGVVGGVETPAYLPESAGQQRGVFPAACA